MKKLQRLSVLLAAISFAYGTTSYTMNPFNRITSRISQVLSAMTKRSSSQVTLQPPLYRFPQLPRLIQKLYEFCKPGSRLEVRTLQGKRDSAMAQVPEKANNEAKTLNATMQEKEKTRTMANSK